MALSDITCPTGQIYAKMRRKTANYASEEVFTIANGGSVLYTSPALANNDLRILETCLAASTNNQYTLTLKDTYGDSWTSPSWLEIMGKHGNIVFKGFLIDNNQETYTISFYLPIDKNAQWKFASGTVAANWYDPSFSDASWSTETMGSTTATGNGAQYFRINFAGLANMAAYELSMNYRYGIVAYINGVEVFRDNIADGPVSSSTVATGSYPFISYHAIIRPGSEVDSTASLLAVELHWTQGVSQTNIDFNAFLAIYATSYPDTNCYVYPYDVTVTTTGSGTATNAWDWGKWTYMYSSNAPNSPISVVLNNDHLPYINALRFWTYSYSNYQPSVYSLGGSMTLGSTYDPIITTNGRTYTTQTMDYKPTAFNGRYARYLSLSVTSTNNGNNMYLYEMNTATCNNGDTITIEFPQESYSFYGIYDDVLVKPTNDEFTSCSISPNVPEGITFDSITCTLSGKGTSASPLTTYTVTSNMQGQSFTGTFALTIEMCAGSILDIRRITKLNSYAEGYTIKDVTTNQIINSETINGSQLDYQDYHTIICCSGTKYRIDMEGTLNYWYPYSFVFLYLVLDEGESEMLGRVSMDSILGTPSSYVFNTHYEFTPLSTWYYKMGEVPENWYNSETSGWTEGTAATFPASTNQIQLYKKTITIDSLTDAAGFTLSLRYMHGCIVYINNNEVYRYGVTGSLSTSSFASTSYSSAIFRSVTLPIVTFALSADNPSKTYLQTGSNTIAIALVAQNNQQTSVYFDAALRILGDTRSNRAFSNYGVSSGISHTQQSTDIFVGNHLRSSYGTTCTDNYLDIYFIDDRKEWISSIVIQNWYEKNEQNVAQFNILAKNNDMTEYDTLKQIRGLKWSYAGQEKRIWIPNNKSYNRFRFQNFGSGNPSACEWRINRMFLYTDSITAPAPALSYTPSVTIFKNVEMAELYPSSDLFTDFSISPALPQGITIDPNTGMISGTASEAIAMTTFTVTARKYNSYETTTATFSLEVTVCTGGKSLITMTIRTDGHPSQGAYKIFQGKGTTGTVVAELEGFPRSNTLFYADFCLNHNIYTAQVISNLADGWDQPAGYMLSVDIGTMRFDVGQVPSGTAPVSVTSYFSSYLPFQTEYDDWKIYKNEEPVASGWNNIGFDDSAWTVTKAADFGTSEAITVYVRKTFTIDDISMYQVLNAHVKYSGGIVAYINGRKVARFNLAEDFTSETESIAIHNPTLFSKFHAILSTVGGQNGENVIAFEIHRPINQPSSAAIVFDATGVFGVNDCSVVLDSFTTLTSTETVGSTIEELFELAPYNSGYLPNAVGSHIEWVVENLEGSKFNSFGMEVPQDASGYGFSVYGYSDLESTDRVSMIEVVNQQLTNRHRMAYEGPVGIAGFRRFRFEIDAAATTPVYVSTYLTQYCKASGPGSYPADGDYPAVGEGQISPGVCSDGFRGYSYRLCTNGKLGEIKSDKCIHKLPAFLQYAQKKYTFVVDAENETDAPTYMNIIDEFYFDDGVTLPEGLSLDSITGKIMGKPKAKSGVKTYTVYGSNPSGVTFTTISFNIREGECKGTEDGEWETTPVGVTAVYECSLKGSYVGTKKRTCTLGKHDGEWQRVSGMCIPKTLIWILVFVAIVIVIAIIVVIKSKMNKTSKNKSKSVKSNSKKVSSKKSSGSKGKDSIVSAKTIKV